VSFGVINTYNIREASRIFPLHYVADIHDQPILCQSIKVVPRVVGVVYMAHRT